LQKRFPEMHRAGRRHINRFIDDFEKRFPRHPGRPAMHACSGSGGKDGK
jgi:hypothetical protein